ncbi:transcriptional regulator [Corynebacterium sp. 13CS0277]|uniref:winged helix-turn-helix transcriptional regulator n=1 Tax=Corynebacterium sp. 13CS0277 TaxID=2071994 RepID=UPI000D040A2C|nr:helix-turn-helix domain-containing protein [Corynebacterium sp. 13CS0277]PRQ11638.1 transcriptional regulator [Corynebacterium sp. 13CS0277]
MQVVDESGAKNFSPTPALPGELLPACPVEIVVGLLSNKWRILIVRTLLRRTYRFNELRHTVTGISQKVLTANLKEMERLGLVHRKVFAEVPPRVEYSLTDVGRSMRPILDAMAAWGEEYRAAVTAGGDAAQASVAPQVLTGG